MQSSLEFWNFGTTRDVISGMQEFYQYEWKSSISRTIVISSAVLILAFIFIMFLTGFKTIDLVVFVPVPAMILWFIEDRRFLTCTVIVTSETISLASKPDRTESIKLGEIDSVKIVVTPWWIKRSGTVIWFESTLAYKLSGWEMLRIQLKRKTDPSTYLIGVSDIRKLEKAIQDALLA